MSPRGAARSGARHESRACHRFPERPGHAPWRRRSCQCEPDTCARGAARSGCTRRHDGLNLPRGRNRVLVRRDHPPSAPERETRSDRCARTRTAACACVPNQSGTRRDPRPRCVRTDGQGFTDPAACSPCTASFTATRWFPARASPGCERRSGDGSKPRDGRTSRTSFPSAPTCVSASVESPPESFTTSIIPSPPSSSTSRAARKRAGSSAPPSSAGGKTRTAWLRPRRG